jgi:hypothetical protein
MAMTRRGHVPSSGVLSGGNVPRRLSLSLARLRLHATADFEARVRSGRRRAIGNCPLGAPRRLGFPVSRRKERFQGDFDAQT